MRSFGKVAGVVGVLALCLFLLLFAPVEGMLWSIAVLSGKQKAGPRETWTDEIARRDFRARRVEVKIAGILLAASVSAIWTGVFLLLAVLDVEVIRSWPTALILVSIMPLLIIYGGLTYLNVMGRGEWQALAGKLERRLHTPVLF